MIRFCILKQSTIFLLLFLYSLGLSGQSDNSCIDDVIISQKKVFEITQPKGDNTIYLNYSIEITDWENTKQKTKVRLYRQGKNVHLFSSQVEMVQDEKEVFLIIHQEKTVMKKDQQDFDLDMDVLDGFKTIQEHFLKSCEVEKCKATSNNENLLVLKNSKGDSYGAELIDKIQYKYNPQSKIMIEVTTSYKSGYPYKQVKQRFQAIDGNADYQFGQSARAYFFEKNGKMRKRFSSYQFIDHQ